MGKPWMPLTLAVLSLAAPVLAADETPKPGDVDAPKAEASEAPGTARLTSKLADEFKVPASEIASLRASGLGWGEIAHALAIAQKAHVPVKDVLALRKSGMGWGQVAQKYGFKLGDVTGKVRGIEREGRKADRDDRAEKRERREERRERRERSEERAEHAPGGMDRGMNRGR